MLVDKAIKTLHEIIAEAREGRMRGWVFLTLCFGTIVISVALIVCAALLPSPPPVHHW